MGSAYEVNGPNGVTIGPDGNLYVTTVGSFIQRYSTAPAYLSTVYWTSCGPLCYPEGITFGPDQNLYFTNNGGDSIWKYDTTTQATGPFIPTGTAGMVRPWDLAFGKDGNLYVGSQGSYGANTTAMVLKFDASGTPINNPFISDPNPPEGAGFTFMTFYTPVVLTPAQIITNLNGLVTSPSLGLNAGTTNSLTSQLQTASSQILAGNKTAAAGSLNAFVNSVQALVKSGRLTSSAATPLINAAKSAISAL